MLAAAILAGTVPAPPLLALQVTDTVKISEVHYDPGENPEALYEFIELYNAGPEIAYLDGAVISDQGNSGSNETTFQFPGTPVTGTTIALQPGAFMLLVVTATGSPYAGIDFEFYGGPADADDAAVPNLVKTSGLGTDLGLANSGDGITLSVGVSNGLVIPCGEIVDGVSWEDGGGAAERYSMSDSICEDPIAHAGTVDGNTSLQRTRNGNDTDCSHADFRVAVRTPKAARPCALDPECLELRYAPCVPFPNLPVQVTLRLLEPASGNAAAKIYYKVSGAAGYDSLAATTADGTTFVALLPARPTQTRVQFYARLQDAAASAWVPESGAAQPAEYRVGATPIAVVQGTMVADSCFSSAYAGTAVNTGGIVTHQRREFDDGYFFMQRGNQPFAGIRVRVPLSQLAPDIGDSVTVSGLVVEDDCQTTVVPFPDCGVVHPQKRHFAPRRLAEAALVDLEENEGLLVTLHGALDVLSGFQGAGDAAEFAVFDGASTAWIGADTFQPDGIGYSFVPVVGTRVDSITGIVAQRAPSATDERTRRRIEPRRDYDVDPDWTGVSGEIAAPAALRIEPNPVRGAARLEFDVRAAGRVHLEVFDAAGRRVRTLVSRDLPAGRGRVGWDGTDERGRVLPAGVYLCRLDVGGASVSHKLVLAR